MSQFEIITNQTKGEITFNFDQLKNQLTEAIIPFANLVVTEDSIQEGKKTRANLNNLKKAINDKKIEIKKEYMKPYEEVESQMKELISIIDTGVTNVDTQVKGFEEMKKQEKFAAIQSYFAELRFDLVSFDRLYDDKWLNATVTEKSWKEQLSGKVETVKADLALLGSFNVADTDLLKSMYLETLNMSVAKERYDAHTARLTKIQEESVQKPRIEVDETQNNAEGNYTVTVTVVDEEILTRTFWVSGTATQIIALGNYMKANGMTFGKVEE